LQILLCIEGFQNVKNRQNQISFRLTDKLHREFLLMRVMTPIKLREFPLKYAIWIDLITVKSKETYLDRVKSRNIKLRIKTLKKLTSLLGFQVKSVHHNSILVSNHLKTKKENTFTDFRSNYMTSFGLIV